MKVSASNIEKTFNQKSNQTMNTQSFGSGRRAKQALTEQIMKYSPEIQKKLIYLGQNDGEILNTLVTGFGTAFIAPLFIAFNPLSKEDKETKIYSAWRQPISAILAVAAQIGINKKFNQAMDLWASTGQLEKIGIDLRNSPASNYLKRIIKLKHPEYTKEQISAEISTMQESAERKAIAEARQNMAGKDFAYTELVSGKEINAQKDKVKEEFAEEIKKIRKEFGWTAQEKFISDKAREKAGKQLGEQLEDIATAKNRIREFKKSGSSIESAISIVTSEQNAIKPTYLDQRQNFEFIDDILNKLTKYKDFNKVKNHLDETSPDLKRAQTLIQDFINKNISTDDALKDLIKQKAEISKSYAISKRQFNLLQNILERLETCKSYEAAQNMKPFQSISNIGANFDEILKNVKIKRFILKNIENSTESLKSCKKWGGIVVSLLTLPVSCGLLNWSYPRIMEKIMPEASKKKKAQEEQNLAGGKNVTRS